MRDFLEEPSEDSFYEHPCSSVFLEAAFQAVEQGNDHISKLKLRQFELEFGLDTGQVAELAYLAQNRIKAIPEELDMLSLTLGGLQ